MLLENIVEYCLIFDQTSLNIADKFYMYLKVLLVFSILLSHAFAIDSLSFKLVSDLNQTQVWVAKENSLKTISLEIVPSQKKYDIKKFNSDKFVRNLELKKKKMLGFIGVTQWKAESYRWDAKKGILNVRGSYLDAEKRRISFYEIHAFSDQSVKRGLLTWPAKTKLSADMLKFVKQKMELK